MVEARLVITAEPAPDPSLTHVLPPSSVPQRPALATPATTMFEQGLAEIKVRLPHSDGMFARFPVEVPHAEGGAATFGAASAHMNDKPPLPLDPTAPPAPAEPGDPPTPPPAPFLDPAVLPPAPTVEWSKAPTALPDAGSDA